MPVEVANGFAEAIFLPNGELDSQNPSGAVKKSRESARRRRRRKQKKNKQNAAAGNDSDTAAEDANGTADGSSKENSDPQKVQDITRQNKNRYGASLFVSIFMLAIGLVIAASFFI